MSGRPGISRVWDQPCLPGKCLSGKTSGCESRFKESDNVNQNDGQSGTTETNLFYRNRLDEPVRTIEIDLDVLDLRSAARKPKWVLLFIHGRNMFQLQKSEAPSWREKKVKEPVWIEEQTRGPNT